MHWYAVNTKRHQEAQAESSLRRLGVETFYPQLRQERLIRRKRQLTICSLFPGYLFARFNFETYQRAVSYARGVRRVVVFGMTPAVVDEDIIQSIQGRLDDGYITIPTPIFTPGQVVRINEGPLQGLEAIFEEQMSDHQRVVLLLRALSYQARVIVDARYVVNL
jgi:transcriptional antiterminator RfaH